MDTFSAVKGMIRASVNGPKGETFSSAQAHKYVTLVIRIRSGDDAAVEELYGILNGGIRFHLVRRLGADQMEDRIHDIFLIVLDAIRTGKLRDPERLMGFVMTIVRCQIADAINYRVKNRNQSANQDFETVPAHKNPEQELAIQQRIDLAKQILRALPAKQREILTRFYLLEHSEAQIRSEMGLTETQFRLGKSRAKARFADQKREIFGATHSRHLPTLPSEPKMPTCLWTKQPTNEATTTAHAHFEELPNDNGGHKWL